MPGPAEGLAAAPAAPTETETVLPPEAEDMLGAVALTHNEQALQAVAAYLRRTLPRAGGAIDAWLKWNVRAGSLIPPVPAAMQASNVAAEVADIRPRVTWSGEGELGAFTSTGSAPATGFLGAFKLAGEGGNWRVGTSGRVDFQKTSNVVAREQIRLTVEPNYKFNGRGYLFGLGQFEEDRFQGFTGRYSLSGGLGYSLLAGPDHKLSVKAGPAWRLTLPVSGPRDSALAGVALVDLKLKLNQALRFSQEASAYFDAERQTYYTLAAVDSQLTGQLKARLSYMVQHEAGEQLGQSLTDTTSRLTLVYGF
nr:DUF481 domain-containing protein [Novosphingobium piscinae]